MFDKDACASGTFNNSNFKYKFEVVFEIIGLRGSKLERGTP